jgi:hypothetical protein
MLKKWLLGVIAALPLIPIVLASGGVIRLDPSIGPGGLPYVVWALVGTFFFLVAITVLSLDADDAEEREVR